jgi:hypothetical protein
MIDQGEPDSAVVYYLEIGDGVLSGHYFPHDKPECRVTFVSPQGEDQEYDPITMGQYLGKVLQDPNRITTIIEPMQIDAIDCHPVNGLALNIIIANAFTTAAKAKFDGEGDSSTLERELGE